MLKVKVLQQVQDLNELHGAKVAIILIHVKKLTPGYWTNCIGDSMYETVYATSTSPHLSTYCINNSSQTLVLDDVCIHHPDLSNILNEDFCFFSGTYF
jgi:hypothetical protein